MYTALQRVVHAQPQIQQEIATCQQLSTCCPRAVMQGKVATSAPPKAAVTTGASSKPVSSATSKIDGALVNLRARALDVHTRLSELCDHVAMLRDGIGPARTSSW